MTIPVTGAARLAKPEAPRAAGRTRRPRGRRGFHRIRRGRRWPVMARRGVCATRRGRWPMRLSRGSGPTCCRPGGGGPPSSTALRCPRRSVVMAVRTAAACPDLAGELACLTRALTAPRGRWPMRLSRGSGPTCCRPGGGGSPSSTALRCPRRNVVMAVRTATACPDLPGELPDPGADDATLRGAEPRAGRARPRRILDARGVLHRLHDIVAGIWHVEGVVPVRDRLTYPQVGCRAHRPGPLLSRTSGGACSGIAWLRTVGEPRLSGGSASEQAYEVLVRLACPALEFRQSPPDLRPDLVTGVPGVIDAGDELPDTDAPKRRCLHLEVF